VGTAITGRETSPPRRFREGAFHAGHYDDDVSALDEVQATQDTVQAGDADVEETLDPVAHEICSHRGFLR
jgi:predicted esterase